MVTNDEELRAAETKVWNYRERNHPEPIYAARALKLFSALSPEEQREVEALEAEIQAFQRERDAKHRLERVREDRDDRLVRSGVEVSNAMARAIVHDTLDATPAVQAARDWLSNENSQPWLVLAGGVGAGKSIAAAYALANVSFPEAFLGIKALWFSATEIARVHSSSFSELVDRAEAARKAEFLVIDDVGTEPDAERMSTALIELLNARQSSRRLTIATTNMTAAQWKSRYPDDRLHSRCAEAVCWVSCVGSDLRRSGGGK